MIPIAKPLIDDQEIENVVHVLKSGMLASGKFVNDLENAFADYIGTSYAVTTTSGTTALDIALKAIRIKSEAEMKLLFRILRSMLRQTRYYFRMQSRFL
jgi:perosamine synthetase